MFLNLVSSYLLWFLKQGGSSTPLLLHWNSVDPYIHFSGSKQCIEPATVSESGIDQNWSNYQFEMNLLSGWMTGGLKNKQEAAIKSILRNRGSLQIIALPTGFGKTRINQITSSILFKNNQGPTLMISQL